MPLCSSPAGAKLSADYARLPLALDHHGILQSSELARSGEHHHGRHLLGRWARGCCFPELDITSSGGLTCRKRRLVDVLPHVAARGGSWGRRQIES
jgi:hypothetical protein